MLQKQIWSLSGRNYIKALISRKGAMQNIDLFYLSVSLR